MTIDIDHTYRILPSLALLIKEISTNQNINIVSQSE